MGAKHLGQETVQWTFFNLDAKSEPASKVPWPRGLKPALPVALVGTANEAAETIRKADPSGAEAPRDDKFRPGRGWLEGQHYLAMSFQQP